MDSKRIGIEKVTVGQLTHRWVLEVGGISSFSTQITSTNEWAKVEFPKLGVPWAVYLADHQTQGRGRNANSWTDSCDGGALLSTWCFKQNTGLKSVFTPVLGLKLYKALKTLSPSMNLKLKPPNDIWLSGGKLSGLLVETLSQGHECWVYVGLGINVFSAPSLNTPTSFLCQSVEIEKKVWFGFCQCFLKGCQEALQQGSKSQISAENCRQLLQAMNQPPPPFYTKVHPNANLETEKGRVLWQNL